MKFFVRKKKVMNKKGVMKKKNFFVTIGYEEKN